MFSSMNPVRIRTLFFLLYFSILLQHHSLCSSSPSPLTCTDTTRLCTSFLAFKPQPNQTLSVIQSMFDVLPEDVTVEGNGRDYVFIRKNCSCASGLKKYITNTTFTIKSNRGFVYDIVLEAYDGLALLPNTTRMARNGAVVSLRLFCACSSGLWNYLMSYVMTDGDTIQSLASRFGVSMDSIESVNGIQNPSNVTVGALYYIPLNSVPGDPYPLETHISPAPTPAPSYSLNNFSDNAENSKRHPPYIWIVGSLGIILVLILLGIGGYACCRWSKCFSRLRSSHSKDPGAKVSHKFHILGKSSFCCASGRYICCSSADWKQPSTESSDNQSAIPKAIESNVFNVDKPVVFSCEEIFSTTDGFSESSLLGHGTYGSVYHGILRDQEVAIKRMTATKTKEFLAEMKVLCKVHHANLVELIGYAASEAELFLI